MKASMTWQSKERVGILGVGHAVPAASESLGSLMTGAAGRALSMAGIAGSEVDLLIGYGSAGELLEPNALAQVHRDLALPGHARVLPVASGYTNFLDGLHLAKTLLESDHARRALVVCGCDRTRRVDYGAGAALLSITSDPQPFAVLDAATSTSTLECRTTPDTLCGALFKRYGISGADVTLIAHQSSSSLLDAWADEIRPAQLLDTLASIPVTLAARFQEIRTRYVLLLGAGIQLRLRALLLGRGQKWE